VRQAGSFITAQLSMHSAGATTMECDVWEVTRPSLMFTGSNYPTPLWKARRWFIRPSTGVDVAKEPYARSRVD
jgi:hypothetical protein